MIKVEWTNADALDLHQLATDCVNRQATIDALCSVCGADCDKSEFVYGGKQEEQVILCSEHYVLTQLPFAQPERKKGKWISVKGSNGKDYHKCSECLHTQDITGVKNYCSVCGAEMMGVQDE